MHVDKWEAWSDAKKAFCCLQGGRGCDKFDCDEHREDALKAWCPERRMWCCSVKQKGCLGKSQKLGKSPPKLPVVLTPVEVKSAEELHDGRLVPLEGDPGSVIGFLLSSVSSLALMLCSGVLIWRFQTRSAGLGDAGPVYSGMDTAELEAESGIGTDGRR